MNMAEWIECTLGDLVTFQRGHDLPKSQMQEGQYPVVGSNGIIGFHNEYTTDNPSITVGRSGNVGKPFIYYGKTWSHNTTLYVKDYKGNDPVFVFYFLKTMDLANYAGGSAVPTLNRNHIHTLPVLIPKNVEIQRKIGTFLKQFDDKIEENERINNNLEQQAQALFKKWFIDNPENVDWSAGTFRELIQSTLNGDWGKEAPTGNNTEKVYCIRGADIPEVKAGNKGKMPTRYILPKNLANKKLEAGDIVVEISGGSPTQSTGRCTAITQSLLDRYDSSMVCTNFCKAIKPKNGYSLFVYYYWQYLYEKGVFFSYENGTTGIKNLDFTGFIETEPIIVPTFDKVQAFDDYCKSIFNQVFANGKQSEQLSSLRDTLLPKLMSGELDVSNIEL